MQRTVPSIKPVFHGRTLKVSIAFATVGASKPRKASRCSGVSVVAMRSLPPYVDWHECCTPSPRGRGCECVLLDLAEGIAQDPSWQRPGMPSIFQQHLTVHD